MKVFKHILSVLLVLSITNVVVGKTIHELFYHHHGAECTTKTDLHFHEVDFFDNDVICNFHFSFGSETIDVLQLTQLNNYKDYLVKTYYTQYLKKIFQNSYSLRGPPSMS